MHDEHGPVNPKGLRYAAGAFALLFFMSGADGQDVAQLSFLLLCAICLLLDEHWSMLRQAMGDLLGTTRSATRRPLDARARARASLRQLRA